MAQSSDFDSAARCAVADCPETMRLAKVYTKLTTNALEFAREHGWKRICPTHGPAKNDQSDDQQKADIAAQVETANLDPIAPPFRRNSSDSEASVDLLTRRAGPDAWLSPVFIPLRAGGKTIAVKRESRIRLPPLFRANTTST